MMTLLMFIDFCSVNCFQFNIMYSRNKMFITFKPCIEIITRNWKKVYLDNSNIPTMVNTNIADTELILEIIYCDHIRNSSFLQKW